MKKKRWLLAGLCCVLFHSATVNAFTTKYVDFIGMPVGGIGTGQIYLGGDGQLWNWDIFNISSSYPGVSGDRYYLNPMRPIQHFANGFGIAVNDRGQLYSRCLNANGFSDITFTGEYPVGKVKYHDRQLPVEVCLQAYSPFIPTDVNNSGLPVTIMEYEVKNISDHDIDVELSGWLQNMSCFQSASESSLQKHFNVVFRDSLLTGVSLTADASLAANHPDWGSLCLALLESEAVASADCQEERGIGLFNVDAQHPHAEKIIGHPLVGGVKKGLSLKKGESHKFTFLLAWNFPNVHLWDAAPQWKDKANLRHYYSVRFKDATAVAHYVAENPQLREQTLAWHNTWYDSTLPTDFLDRTFANVSTLATSATVRFHDTTGNPANEGRYYNFEGVYLGDGTCRHVSHYGQVLGRVFPALARHHRQQIDLGLSFSKEGIIGYRGEFSHEGHHDGRGYAADGQAGTILSIYREHLMAPDNDFLKQNWQKTKLAMQYMIAHDREKSGTADGILEGAQYNTLDRMWYGKIPWISGLYIAALHASAEMAETMGDNAFAKECRKIAKSGTDYISTHLFNGEYFVQELDSLHLDAPNSNYGCHLDQLLGQFWTSQLNLGAVFPEEQVNRTLQSIMKYNYVDHYADYLRQAAIPVSRWYAEDDEPGLIGCTFPRGGADKAPGKIKNDWEKLVVGYFSEMFTGQEHAIAALLLSAGKVDDAFKVEKAVNQRYTPERRNPYNEIEYGNHYTRAMSSYAPFVAASGFVYNGPQGLIGFHPVVGREHFRSAFITSEGWGTFEQNLGEKSRYTLQLKYGKLRLNTLDLSAQPVKMRHWVFKVNDKVVKTKLKQSKDNARIVFTELSLKAGDEISLCLQP